MRHIDSRQNPARKTGRKFRFTPTPFVLLLLTFCIVSFILYAPNSSLSSTGSPKFALKELDGVKKIFFTTRYMPKGLNASGYGGKSFFDVAQSALKDIFSQQDSSLMIKPFHQAQTEEHGGDVLIINFFITIREEPEHQLKSAALSFQLEREWSNSSSSYPYREVHVYPKTYPFIVPSNAKDYNTEVKKGIIYLLSFLPSYLDCADKIVRSHQCTNLKSEYDGE